MESQQNLQNTEIEEERQNLRRREQYEKPAVIYQGKLEAYALVCANKTVST